MGGSKSKGGSPPAPVAAPIAPTVAVAVKDAKAEQDKRRRISVLNGGITNLTAESAATTPTGSAAKSLIGQ